MSDFKQKEEKEILRLTDESKKRIDNVRQQIELEQIEHEKTYKQVKLIHFASLELTHDCCHTQLPQMTDDISAAVHFMFHYKNHCRIVCELQEQYVVCIESS